MIIAEELPLHVRELMVEIGSDSCERVRLENGKFLVVRIEFLGVCGQEPQHSRTLEVADFAT